MGTVFFAKLERLNARVAHFYCLRHKPNERSVRRSCPQMVSNQPTTIAQSSTTVRMSPIILLTWSTAGTIPKKLRMVVMIITASPTPVIEWLLNIPINYSPDKSGNGCRSCESATRVCGPATPTGLRPTAFWKRMSASVVTGPKYPVGSCVKNPCLTSIRCITYTSYPVIPGVSSRVNTG